MTDFCTAHDMDFQGCPCPDRRTTDRALQILVCAKCNHHITSCRCDTPDFEPRVWAHPTEDAMPLYVRNKGADFTPAPAGLHHAVCVDAIDLGMVEGNFGKKHMVKLAWQLKQTMDNGKPYLVLKRYGASLHPKSVLRADLESWRGKKFTEDEAGEFDLEKLIGVNCQLMIIHAVKEGTTYGNVASIVPAPSVLGKLMPRDYQRVSERPGYVAPEVDDGPPPDDADAPPPDLEDAPF